MKVLLNFNILNKLTKIFYKTKNFKLIYIIINLMMYNKVNIILI